MNTLIVRMSLDPACGAEVLRHFEQDVVPWAKRQPGFVSGQWLRTADGEQGMGVLVFESAEAANAAAEGPRRYVRDEARPWNIESVTVFEQVARA